MSEPAKIQPAPSDPAAAAPANKPSMRQLKKGEMLFTEGENSRSMYFLKSGMIRIFKRKGDSQIELDTIHAGSVLGELAFLDGNPRSASGEALIDSTVVDISQGTFMQTLSALPDWMKLLLKTLVGRLRTASTRLKQLEEASTTYDYSGGKDGKKGPQYIYINTNDCLKICSGVLLASARHGHVDGNTSTTKLPLINRYANQISQVPLAKVTDMLDVLASCEVLTVGGDGDSNKIVVQDLSFLEKFIGYLNEENLKESSKRKYLSPKGFAQMAIMVKHMGTPTKDGEGIAAINLAEVKKRDTAENGGKERFKMEDFNELVIQKFCSAPSIKSNDDMKTSFHYDTFMQLFRYQRVQKALEKLNEDKVNKKK